MWYRISLSALGALTLLAQPSAAASPIAEVVCAPRAEMEARLQREQQARLTASGVRDPETVMEVWSSPAGRWVMVIRYAEGQSCIVALGEAWDAVAAEPS